MRQLLIQVPRGKGKSVLELAASHQGANLACLEGMSTGGPIDWVIIHVPNRDVEGLLQELEDLPELHLTLVPRGVIPLQPPADEAPDQVTNVESRSPIEIFLAGLQSVGSWQSFLSYAALAGVVVWIGLFTNTVYLLVAAMLVAPFAGPAMNTAIATARGDWTLLRRSLIRYFAALAVTIVVTALLSLILQQEVASSQMVEVSQISMVAVLLPIAAGAAGALQLTQSDRSSLVSGAAIGMLVAASLAPPAGLIGMAGAIGEWDMAIGGVFLLLLQLAGINISGAVIFRLSGLSPRGARYKRGKKHVFPMVLVVTALVLTALLTWQFASSPELQRSSQAQRATAEIQSLVQADPLAELVVANVQFTRADIEQQNTLLGVIYVQRAEGVTEPAEEIRDRLTRQIQSHLLAEGFNVTPLIDIIVLESPEDS